MTDRTKSTEKHGPTLYGAKIGDGWVAGPSRDNFVAIGIEPVPYVPEALVRQARAEAERIGIRKCIDALRQLQDEYRHQSKWNSSGVTTFAPVELSDWLLNNVAKAARSEGGEA